MPVASSRGAEHVVWGAPEISSSSESGSDLRSFDGKGRSGSRGSSSRNSRRRELEDAQRHFQSLTNRLQGSEDGRRHRVMSSATSNATSTSTESHSPSLSRRDRKDQPPSPKFPKAEWDGFYRKMKELSKASRDSEVPADRPRAWDPTAPIEELKKLLEEDFEGVCAYLEDPERAEAEETDSEEADAAVPEGEGEWSVGSEGHAQGQCRPCHYVFAKTGCQNGRECNFCHLPHPKRFRPRPCKSKRFKCKQLAAVLDQVLDDDPDSFQNVVEQLSSQGGYLNTVVKSKLRTMAKRSAKSEARSSADTAGPEAPLTLRGIREGALSCRASLVALQQWRPNEY
eukprot:s1529_g3.t2